MSEREAMELEFKSHGDNHLIHAIPLRDWFAGQALVGLLSQGHLPCNLAAGASYEFADAMLEARSK